MGVQNAAMDYASQSSYEVRLEWGAHALQTVATNADVVVVVDVLSFSTCVDIACARGAAVLPFTYKDDRARAYARERQAELAVSRSESGFSLSPASLLSIERGTRLVLPSPNGATVSLQARAPVVLAGSFRNYGAVAAFAAAQPGAVLVVAAGERWADGSLRPAIEDLLCAGAIVDGLRRSRSPEAMVAAAAFNGVRDKLVDVVGKCASAVELRERGFAADVELALDFNVSRCVPRLVEGAYVAAV
jgi:2-phosphosulfolactate phosphatase